MTKKDYIKAAKIATAIMHGAGDRTTAQSHAYAVQEAFIRLFSDDNPQFDVERFRAACNEEK